MDCITDRNGQERSGMEWKVPGWKGAERNGFVRHYVSLAEWTGRDRNGTDWNGEERIAFFNLKTRRKGC